MTRARELARLANENVLSVEDDSLEVGINSTTPTSALDVRGQLNVGTAIKAGTAGVVTATEFSGSIGTFSGAGSFGGNLDVTGNVTIGGTLTYEDVTNIDVIGIVTAQNGVNISGGQLLVGSGVTIGNAGVATFSGTSDIHLKDNVRLNVGDGSDLAIYHDNSHSYLEETGTGALKLKGDDIRLENSSGNNIIKANTNVAELFNNGNKKFETTNDGTVTTGIATVDGLRLGDNEYISVGAGGTGDIQIHHNGSHSAIKNSTGVLQIMSDHAEFVNAENSVYKARYIDDGAVELYYNGTKKFETTNDGTVTTGIATATGGVAIDATFSEASSDGNDLVIGSTSDTAKGLSIVGSTSGGIGNIFFSDGASYKNQGNIQYRHADDSMRFSANQTEAFRIDSSQRLLIGSTSNNAVWGVNAALQVEGTSGDTSAIHLIRNTNDGGGAMLTFGKSRATSDGGSTIVQSGDVLGHITWVSADGTDMNSSSAAMTVEVDGTPGSNDTPGRILFKTTPDGASGVTERLRITSEGGTKFTRLTSGGAETVGNDPGKWFKIGTWAGSTVDAAARATITVIGAATHDSNSNVSGETKIHLAFSSNPTLYGYFYSTTATREGVAGVAHKYDSSAKSAEIWIKYAEGYSSTACYADVTNGFFTGENTNTTSTSTPTGATLLDSYFNIRTSDGTNSGQRFYISSSGDTTIKPDSTTKLQATGTTCNLRLQTSNTGATTGDGLAIQVDANSNTYFHNYENGDMYFGTNNTTKATYGKNREIKFTNSTITERMHYDSGAGIQSDYNHSVMDYGMVWFGATNPVAAWTMNLRGDGSTAFNDLIDNNTTTTFTQIAASSNASYYMTAFKIDGTTQTVEWAGGSAPSAATASGYDSYVITIFKSASNQYKCFGNFTNFDN